MPRRVKLQTMSDNEKRSESEVSTSWDGQTDPAVPSQEILELEHVYDALGHTRRRYLCYTLLEDTEWSLAELATKIAAWENDVEEQEVGEHQHERVYVSLYHAHVPKLIDEDVIAFDEQAETITPAENATQVLDALRGMGASLDAAQETHARGAVDEQ